MSSTCPECGAVIPEGGSCRDHFHALLLLEAEIPGGPSSLAHFYAVASYGLQHPQSMNYTEEALTGLRAALAEMLDGRLTLPELRHWMRRTFNGPQRVLRREGNAIPSWPRGAWSMNVADVLTVEAHPKAYEERVQQWAHSIRAVLDAEG